MELSTSLRLNTPRIASEVIDGEALLIDFERGIYYSAEGAGGVIIEQLASDVRIADLVAAVAARYSASRDEIRAGVVTFVRSLLDEELIAELPEGANDVASRPAETTANLASPDDAIAFAMPVLRKYSDLKDLLLLDPIHDTDVAGWPTAVAQLATAGNRI